MNASDFFMPYLLKTFLPDQVSILLDYMVPYLYSFHDLIGISSML